MIPLFLFLLQNSFGLFNQSVNIVSLMSLLLDDYTYRAAICHIVTAALWNRAGHYIFALWFLLLSFYLSFLSLVFSSPVLSRRRLDVYHTSTHRVAVVRI